MLCPECVKNAGNRGFFAFCAKCIKRIIAFSQSFAKADKIADRRLQQKNE